MHVLRTADTTFPASLVHICDSKSSHFHHMTTSFAPRNYVICVPKSSYFRCVTMAFTIRKQGIYNLAEGLTHISPRRAVGLHRAVYNLAESLSHPYPRFSVGGNKYIDMRRRTRFVSHGTLWANVWQPFGQHVAACGHTKRCGSDNR